MLSNAGGKERQNERERKQQLNTIPKIINCISLIEFIPDIILH